MSWNRSGHTGAVTRHWKTEIAVRKYSTLKCAGNNTHADAGIVYRLYSSHEASVRMKHTINIYIGEGLVSFVLSTLILICVGRH